MEKYYSTSSFLAYSINKHIYGDKHYVWAAKHFYAYGMKNPKSSNPLLIYMDMYQPFKDADQHDKFVLQHRLNLRKGIRAKWQDGSIDPSTYRDLKRIADRVSTTFFCPVVYALDITPLVNANRAVLDGSGNVGSSEYKITDLTSDEFELLFDDFSDPLGDFNNFRKDPGSLTISHVLTILLARCV